MNITVESAETEAKTELQHLFELIKDTAKQAKRSVYVHFLSADVKAKLVKLGYSVSHAENKARNSAYIKW